MHKKSLVRRDVIDILFAFSPTWVSPELAAS
jgi:hypothetical protein